MVTVHYVMEPGPKIRKYSLRTVSPKSSSREDSVCRRLPTSKDPFHIADLRMQKMPSGSASQPNPTGNLLTPSQLCK